MMPLPRALIGCAMLLLVVAACDGGPGPGERPVGIGRAPDALKRSPCACIPVDQAYPEGWEQDVMERLRAAG